MIDIVGNTSSDYGLRVCQRTQMRLCMGIFDEIEVATIATVYKTTISEIEATIYKLSWSERKSVSNASNVTKISDTKTTIKKEIDDLTNSKSAGTHREAHRLVWQAK